jgi:hypothetical protein
MKVKTFRGFGEGGIAQVQREANEWLRENEPARIVDTSTAMCSVGHSGEISQCFVITIFYEGAIPKK